MWRTYVFPIDVWESVGERDSFNVGDLKEAVASCMEVCQLVVVIQSIHFYHKSEWYLVEILLYTYLFSILICLLSFEGFDPMFAFLSVQYAPFMLLLLHLAKLMLENIWKLVYRTLHNLSAFLPCLSFQFYIVAQLRGRCSFMDMMSMHHWYHGLIHPNLYSCPFNFVSFQAWMGWILHSLWPLKKL